MTTAGTDTGTLAAEGQSDRLGRIAVPPTTSTPSAPGANPTRLPGAPVELVHWPRDAHLRSALARAGIARLLLVAERSVPPDDVDVNEDWIRLPADERDVAHRLERLSTWVAHLAAGELTLDLGQRLAYRGGRVALLSATEASLIEALVAQRGTLVGRDELETHIWPNGSPNARSLDNLVYRVRGRLAPLGVAIRSSRTRGFALDVDGAEPASAAGAR
jgi:two-component system OmpR family response regulator